MREYAAGRTPIPCVHCNGQLKFASLVERARGLDADAVATGHYARVERDAGRDRYVLRRGADAAKDQSYFLFTLDAVAARARALPRRRPRQAGRPRARRGGWACRWPRSPTARRFCFVPSGEHAAFVERRAPEVRAPGAVTDRAGRVLGRHDGIHRFTVGQRKGLGLSSTTPLYVLAIDAPGRTVVVGPRAALDRPRFTARDVNWMLGAPPAAPLPVTAQVRYRHRAAPARVSALDERPRRGRLRRAAARHRARPGGRLLRRRRGGRRGMD